MLISDNGRCCFEQRLLQAEAEVEVEMVADGMRRERAISWFVQF
jgi:hypothetical protein